MFWAAVAGMWAFLFVQSLHVPVLLDDWYQLTWYRTHSISVSSIWEYGHYNYFHFNPRLGDVLLVILNGPRWINLVATPLVELSLPLFCFALAFGRWPKPGARDLWLLLVLQLAIWLVAPLPGVVYFYRPFATNYLWSFTTTLALLVPYRLELARETPGPARHWLAPILFVVGWCAGMGNEHTGPVELAGMAGMLWLAYRKRRLRPWMIAGALGLFIGYPMLLFAPGQKERYAGRASRTGPLHTVAVRGFSGNSEIVLDFVGEAQLAVDFVAIVALVALRRARKQGASAAEALGAFTRERGAVVLVLALGALGIVGTQFASPFVGERLFFAPAVLVAIALGVVVEWLFGNAGARKAIVWAVAIVFGYHIVRFVTVQWEGWRENQHRLHVLETAPKDSDVKIPAYGLYRRTRWWPGDDLKYASLREYVANEVYDLRSLDFEPFPRWAEPAPPEHYVATRTFDPPLTPAEDAKLAPRYVPSYWEWAIVQLRRSILLGPIKFVEGHKLVHYVVDIAHASLDDPKHRPVRVIDWTPDEATVIEAGPYDDKAGRPFVLAFEESVPEGIVDTYVVGCGRTEHVEPEPNEDHIGPMVPIDLTCHGTYTVYMCDPAVCWSAGRYWK